MSDLISAGNALAVTLEAENAAPPGGLFVGTISKVPSVKTP